MPQLAAAAFAAFSAAAASTAAAVTTALTTAGVAASTAAAIGGAVGVINTALQVVGGVMQVASALGIGQKQPALQSTWGRTQLTIDAAPGLKVAVGETAVAGTLRATFQVGRKSDMFQDIVALSSAGPIGAIHGVIIERELYTIAGDGRVSYAPDNMFCYFRLGAWDQTSLTPIPLAAHSQPPGWGSNHRGAGVAHALLAYLEDPKAFPKGKPRPLVRVSGHTGVIDPRTGTTATEAARDLAACWEYTWRLGLTSSNGTRLGGHFKTTQQIDTAAYAAWANRCEALNLRVSGQIDLDQDDVEAVSRALMQAGAATYCMKAGLDSVVFQSVKTVVGTITEADVAGPVEIITSPEIRDRANGVIPSFTSPAHGWEVVPGSMITATDYQTEDGGLRQASLVLPFVANATQAGVVAGYQLVQSRERLFVKGSFHPRVLAFAPGDAVTLDLPTFGVSSVKCIVEGRDIGPKGGITLALRSETDSKHAWATGQSSTVPDTTLPQLADGQPPQPDAGQWTATAAQITASGDSQPIIRVTGSASDYPQGSSVVIKCRLAASGSPWLDDGRTIGIDSTVVELDTVTPAMAYVVGVAYRNGYGREGTVRELSAVTTGARVAGSVAPGAVRVGTNIFPAGTGTTPLPGTELLNTAITINGAGAITNIGTGTGTVVQNSLLLPQIDAVNDLLNPNSHFTNDTLAPWTVFGAATITREVVSGRPVLRFSTTDGTALTFQLQPGSVPAGSTVASRIRMRMVTGTWDNIWAYNEFRLANNSIVYSENAFLTTVPTTSGYSVSGSMTGTHEFELIGTIPGTAHVTIVQMSLGVLSNPVGTSKVFEVEFLGYRILTQQERRARGMETGANVTETRTAAAINGQAPAATDPTIETGATRGARIGTNIFPVGTSTTPLPGVELLNTNTNLTSTAATRPASGQFVGQTHTATDTGLLTIWNGSAWVNGPTRNTGALANVDTVNLAGSEVIGTLPTSKADTALQNANITISGGALNGIGTGAGTVVANSAITISGGNISGIGTGNGTAIANTSITVSGGALSGIGTGNGTVVDNTIVTPTGLASARPASGSFNGQTYFASDTRMLSRWNGSAWVDGPTRNTGALANVDTVNLAGTEVIGTLPTSKADTALQNTTVALSGLFSARPGSGAFTGQLYTATDTSQLFRWNGSAWVTSADVTSTAQVTISTPPTLFIQCNHLGAPLAGQLPAVVGVVLKRGTSVVSGQAACTLPNLPASITATIDDSTAATAGNVTITAVTANGTVNVQMVLDGVTFTTAFAVQRVLAPAPTPAPGGATSATATVSGSPNSATLITVSGEMTITTGSAGTISLGGGLDYTRNSGIGTNQAFARWQRLISAVWTDVGTEIAAATNATNFTDSETGALEKNPGSLDTATTLTGLGANTTHTLRLRARQRTTDTNSIDIVGVVTGTGS